jgi:hypothetical protein
LADCIYICIIISYILDDDDDDDHFLHRILVKVVI